MVTTVPPLLRMTMARQLGRHEVAHDREPQAGGVVDVEALGQSAPVVADLKGEAVVVVGQHEVDLTDGLAVGVPDRPRRSVPEGKACSTAFCSSSARTTASGVATSAPTSPMSPVTLDVDAVPGDGRVLGHPHQRAHDLVEGNLVARLARQDLVDEGDRPHPPLGLAQAPPGPDRAAAGPAAAAATRSSAGCS